LISTITFFDIKNSVVDINNYIFDIKNVILDMKNVILNINNCIFTSEMSPEAAIQNQLLISRIDFF